MNFTEDNGTVKYDRVTDVLYDVTDGYLSNKPSVTYMSGASSDGLGRVLGDSDAEQDELASELLSSISTLSRILRDYQIKGKEEAYVLERAVKKTGQISKLSDKYSLQDATYANNHHQDVIDICSVLSERYSQLTEK